MFSFSKTAAPLFRLAKDKRGNVLMIMGFALIPLTMAAGMTVDYTRAGRLKTKLDAAADAAVLAAVAESALSADDKTVCERAAKLFDSQARGNNDIGYNRANIVLTVGSQSTRNNVTYNGNTNTCSTPTGVASSAASRVVSLKYAVDSNNYFGGLFNMASLPVSGNAEAEVSIAPDIDFYIALDTSPSMALPVTTSGINALVSATAMYNSSGVQTKEGCAFACHSNKIQQYVGATSSLGETPQDTAKYAINKTGTRNGTFGGLAIRYVDNDNTFVYRSSANKKFCYQSGKYGQPQSNCAALDWRTDTNIYNSDGSFVDTYWYTRNKTITLRIDEMRRATSDLVVTALDEASRNDAVYRAAIYAFDYQQNFREIQSMVKIAEKPTAATYSATVITGNAFKATANSNAIDVALVDDIQANGCPRTNCSGNNYRFTSFKGLFDGAMFTGRLPATSGRGTRTVGDTPQAFLFIVTDGMSDEIASYVGGTASLGEDRTRSEMTSSGTDNHQSKCAAIKARGVQIAILYTEYTAASIASDEASQRNHVTSRLPFVEPALERCASPGYMLKVSSDGDISGALQALLRKAVSKPRLVR